MILFNWQQESMITDSDSELFENCVDLDTGFFSGVRTKRRTHNSDFSETMVLSKVQIIKLFKYFLLFWANPAIRVPN